MYKPISIIIALSFFILKMGHAQDLTKVTIDECYQWTSENYPLVKQLGLIEKSKAFNLNNAFKGYLPQVNINGQATYQSDVTSLPISLPNVEIPTVSKDQYKIYADIYQPLTNGSMIKLKQKSIEATAKIEAQNIEVNLYQLKERVNQLYFGILLIDGQLKQFDIFKNDLTAAIEKVEAAIENGTAVETNKLLLQSELINLTQKIQEKTANKTAFSTMLAALTGKGISAKTVFERPQNPILATEINRPELQLFDLKRQTIDLKSEQIKNRWMPNVGLFAQTGFGRPALNFLSNDFEFYFIGGVKANWNISGLYTNKNEEQLISISKLKIDVTKETFLLHTNLAMTQQNNEVAKFQGLINTDKELITIRKQIKETAEVQLNNGLISALDYISYINGESKAQENLLLHQIQLLMAQYQLKTTSGN
jgi:outer membrane protein TolC